MNATPQSHCCPRSGHAAIAAAHRAPTAQKRLLSPMWPAAGILLASLLNARAIVYHSTNGIAHNVSAPTGALASAGWQYTGKLGVYTGTAIAPNAVLTAKHLPIILGVGFTYEGQTFTTTSYVADVASDLAIWRVNGVFTNLAPLYAGHTEAGHDTFVVGRGQERGTQVATGGITNGWRWGGHQRILRWGRNHIEGYADYALANDLLMGATFDIDGLPDEAMLSAGDSGGGAFIQVSNTWHLAGVHYAVHPVDFSPYPEGTNDFAATLYDISGLYYDNGDTWLYATPTNTPQPCAFFSTRVSRRLPWIWQVVPELAPPPSPTIILIR